VTRLVQKDGSYKFDSKMQPMHIPRVAFAALQLKTGGIFVSGGMTTGNSITNLCEEIGGSQIASMVRKRISHSMCQVGEYVYVFGGMDENH
jgi:hypothetical protein